MYINTCTFIHVHVRTCTCTANRLRRFLSHKFYNFTWTQISTKGITRTSSTDDSNQYFTKIKDNQLELRND